MIDEKRIAEAAHFATDTSNLIEVSRGMFAFSQEALDDAFKAGAYWYLDNLWHDSSDAPTYGEKCLVELADNYNDSNKIYVVSANYRGGGWDRNVSDLVSDFDYKIIRWLYIDDLLKEGIEIQTK